jgi:hypothetical protein
VRPAKDFISKALRRVLDTHVHALLDHSVWTLVGAFIEEIE